MKKIMACLLIIVAGYIRANNPINLIDQLEVNGNTIRVKVNEEFREKYLRSDFFITYDSDIPLDKFDDSILVLPFITNVLSIIWISGEKYTIPSIDEDIFLSLKKVKKVFQRMYPSTKWDGELIPKKLIKKQATGTVKKSCYQYCPAI